MSGVFARPVLHETSRRKHIESLKKTSKVFKTLEVCKNHTTFTMTKATKLIGTFLVILTLCLSCNSDKKDILLSNDHFSISIDEKGFVKQLIDQKTKENLKNADHINLGWTVSAN